MDAVGVEWMENPVQIGLCFTYFMTNYNGNPLTPTI